jgi:hypothetical protein
VRFGWPDFVRNGKSGEEEALGDILNRGRMRNRCRAPLDGDTRRRGRG